MPLRIVRQRAVAVAVAGSRLIAVAGLPVVVAVDLVVVLAAGSGLFPLSRLLHSVHGFALAIALADWLRSGVVAALARADAERDVMLAQLHDRVDDVRERSRSDLDQAVRWLLRRARDHGREG